jgi:hypothetical protein
MRTYMLKEPVWGSEMEYFGGCHVVTKLRQKLGVGRLLQ